MNRSYDYDEVGRLWEAHTGNEAEAHIARVQFPPDPTGPYSHSYRYDVWGNMGYRVGWGGTFGVYTKQTHAYANNRRVDFQYDLAGNLSNDGAQYTYDATGQQTNGVYAPGWGGYASYTLQQAYDGDALRAKKVDNGTATYYLRSSVLGGQVIAEMDAGGTWQRGYVYLGGQLLAIQQNGTVNWVHQDPVTKSQRLTDTQGKVIAAIDLDAWGAETARSWSSGLQPRKFTTYERDGNGNDQAMMRQYHGYYMRFDQPDPYAGSMSLADPQSLNRYAYVQNDPVNFVDPSGLNLEAPSGQCGSGEIRVMGPDGVGRCVRAIQETVYIFDSGPGVSLFGGNIFGRVQEIGLITLPNPVDRPVDRIFERARKARENETDAERRSRMYQDCFEEAWEMYNKTAYKDVNRFLGTVSALGGGVNFVVDTLKNANVANLGARAAAKEIARSAGRELTSSFRVMNGAVATGAYLRFIGDGIVATRNRNMLINHCKKLFRQ